MGNEVVIYDRENFYVTDKVIDSWFRKIIPVPASSTSEKESWSIIILLVSAVMLRLASVAAIAVGVSSLANFMWFAGSVMNATSVYLFVCFVYAYITSAILKRDPRMKYQYNQEELFFDASKFGYVLKPMMVIMMTGLYLADQRLNVYIATRLGTLETVPEWSEIPTLTPWMIALIYSAVMYIACRFVSTDTMTYYDYQLSKVTTILMKTPLSQITFIWGFRPKKDNLFDAIAKRRSIIVCYGSELNAVLRTATYNFEHTDVAAVSVDLIIVVPDKPISQMAGEFLYKFFIDKYPLDPMLGVYLDKSAFSAIVRAICYATSSKNKPHIFLTEKISGKDIGRIDIGEPLPRKKRNLQDVMNERRETQEGGEI